MENSDDPRGVVRDPRDQYLDQRHRNWALAEEFGDVIFDYERGVVLVHRVRAEHIARALGAYSQTPASGPPTLL